MRVGGQFTVSFLMIAALFGTQARADERLVMNEIAPWVKDDISIAPRLLTTKDVANELNEDDDGKISAKTKSKIKSLSADDDSAPDKTGGVRKEISPSLPEQSPLEKMYAQRISQPVAQFGYDSFASAQKSDRLKSNVPTGAIQSDYVLSVGDQLSVLLRGQKQDAQIVTITTEGMLVVDDLPPIPAAGRSFGEVRDQLKDEVSKLYNTDVFLSLSNVSQINVLVVGHVNAPGRQSLTNFDTVLDALIAAGGIEKTGTLRQIRLIRNDKTVLIDLYGLLIFGSDGLDLSLRNGDKIIVQPIGPTVAVTGDVKRDGIYEILPALKANWDRPSEKSQRLSMNDLLSMAGGVLSPAVHRYLRMDMTDNGREDVATVADPGVRIFSDGDILNIERADAQRSGSVELLGNANQKGLHSLADTESLSSLLYDDSVVGPETYPLIGIIERWNKSEMSKELISFSPKLVLSGDQDRKLENGDQVYLFSQDQIENLKNADPQAQLIEASLKDSDDPHPKHTTKTISKAMQKFLIERSVFVRGAIRDPGSYPVAEGATLDTVLAVAGGPTLEGSKKNIEISSDQDDDTIKRKVLDLTAVDPHGIRLKPGDTIRVNQKFRRVEDNHVLLIGEVKNPGTFDLQPGDTLGKLLARAGGLTDEAYPDGTIFSRLTERRREEARFKAEAQDLELRLATMLQQDDKDKKPDPENINIAKDLISELKNTDALGRITVEANPAILKSKPQLDILLESGDRIYIPKRPLTVRVAGEVLSPAALQFRTEKKPREYINEAGGMSYNADDDRAFVVYPDGSAQPLAISAWNHNAIFVPPGSTIIVPRDPKPYSFIDGAKDISQILANVATAAIFADDLRDNRN